MSTTAPGLDLPPAHHHVRWSTVTVAVAVAVLAAFAVWLLALDSRSAHVVPTTPTQLVVDPVGDPGPACDVLPGWPC